MWNQENQCYTGTHFGMVKITKCLGISVRCRIININKYIYIYIYNCFIISTCTDYFTQLYNLLRVKKSSKDIQT